MKLIGIVGKGSIFVNRNACPVKEEVVAPFWANNTRGEVLALLNLCKCLAVENDESIQLTA